MSRIHEALRKIDQERGATQEDLSAAPVTEIPVPVDVPRDGGIAAAHIPNPFGLESLLAKSSRAQWSPNSSTMLFLNGDDSVRGTEEFRTLRSRLYHARERMPLKKLLITSPLPKEGKSFTCANLAQVLVRQHDRRVLLIDADLRGPRLHLMLGTSSSPGLSDYLRGTSDEFSVMQRGRLENLFFIPSGGQIDDPSDLIGNGRLKNLLLRVEPLFDWIIVDSPPAVPVSDSSVLAKACDGVLIVVRSNSTPFDAARRAREEFSEQMLVGVVLNGIVDQNSHYARYYYETYEKPAKEGKGSRP